MENLRLPREFNFNSINAWILDYISHRGKNIAQDAVFSSERSKPYGRKVLLQDGDIELLLTGWESGYSCWPHTHGEQSEGVVAVLEGVGTFQIFSSPTKDAESETKTRSAGQTIFIPRGELHSMRNDSKDPLVCLHAYWPPVAEMWVYDPSFEVRWRVSGGGAWRPIPEHVLEKRRITHES